MERKRLFKKNYPLAYYLLTFKLFVFYDQFAFTFHQSIMITGYTSISMIDPKLIAVRKFSYDHIIGRSGNYMCPQSLYFIVIYHVTWNLIIQKSCLHVEGRNDNSKIKIMRYILLKRIMAYCG